MAASDMAANSISPACVWHQHAEEAANIISTVITPLFLNTMRTIKDGSVPALVARPEEEWTSLERTIARLTEMLCTTSAWSSREGGGKTSRQTVSLLRARAKMVAACLAATTAALDGTHNSGFDIINSRYLIILSAAVHALQSWYPTWPSEHVLSNQQSLASLDYLLGKIVDISRQPPALELQEEVNRVVMCSAGFLDGFITSVAMLPQTILVHIATLPPTLMIHTFNLLDEQLLSILCFEGLDRIDRIAAAVDYFLTKLAQCKHEHATMLCTALAGFAKHLLVTCVLSRNLEKMHSSFTPEAMKFLESKALSFLRYASQITKSHTQSMDGLQTRSTSKRLALACKPTVSEGQYFHALCRCAASRILITHDECDIFANLHIQRVLQSSRTVNGTLIVSETLQLAVCSLLQLLSRKAQQRMQSAHRLEQSIKQQWLTASFGETMEEDARVVQSIFLDVCSIVRALTGSGVKPLSHGMYANFPGPAAAKVSPGIILQWLGTAGCSVSIEAHLRDPHMRGASIDQHAAACIALMVLCAPCHNTALAVQARISLAATLRKLMHPASAPMWAAAAATTDLPGNVWRPASECSATYAERCVRVINALSQRNWDFNTLLDAELERKQGGKAIGVTLVLSGGSLFELCASQQVQRMSVILAATHVQLCKCSGNEKLGESAYLQLNPICPVATKLLRARPMRATAGCAEKVARLTCVSWERFATTHFTGRLLPGCSHWGCTNMEGSSEAALPTLLCSGCRRARYCCVGCQMAAWVGGHREICCV